MAKLDVSIKTSFIPKRESQSSKKS